jgi:hypothetical protein
MTSSAGRFRPARSVPAGIEGDTTPFELADGGSLNHLHRPEDLVEPAVRPHEARHLAVELEEHLLPDGAVGVE